MRLIRNINDWKIANTVRQCSAYGKNVKNVESSITLRQCADQY